MPDLLAKRACVDSADHLAHDACRLVTERDLRMKLGEAAKVKLVRALEMGLDTLDATWLARIESAQRADPRDATLQYLAGMACMKRQLWGKAQTYLEASLALEDDWRTHLALGEMLGRLGNSEEANSHFVAALKLATEELKRRSPG